MKKQLFVLAFIGMFSCKSDNTTSVTPDDTTTTSDVDISVVQAKFSNSGLSVTVEGNYLVIKSNGIPNHKI